VRTLIVNPRLPISCTPQAPTIRSPIGGGQFQARRRATHLFKEFRFNAQFTSRGDAEDFQAFMQFHQGDTPFWFDGGDWGDIQTPVHIAFGDGSTTDFYLPRLNCLAPSWVLHVNRVLRTDWTMFEGPGLVSFGAPPPANAEITGYGRNRFKCVFWFGDTMSPQDEDFEDDLGGRIYQQQEIVLREVA